MHRYSSSKKDIINENSLIKIESQLDKIDTYIDGFLKIRGDGSCTDTASFFALLLTCISENQMDYFNLYLNRMVVKSEEMLKAFDNKGFNNLTFKKQEITKELFSQHIENFRTKIETTSIQNILDEFLDTAVSGLDDNSFRLSWIILSKLINVAETKETLQNDFDEYIKDNPDLLKADGDKSAGETINFCTRDPELLKKQGHYK